MKSDLPSFEDHFAVKEEDEILKLFLSFYSPTFFPMILVMEQESEVNFSFKEGYWAWKKKGKENG